MARGRRRAPAPRSATVDIDDDGRLRPARVRERALAAHEAGRVQPRVERARPGGARRGDLRRRPRPRRAGAHRRGAVGARTSGSTCRPSGCDFLACSSHKMLGPMGVGVLWARRSWLESMPPYQLGSNMAHEVEATRPSSSTAALKYQAGTPNVPAPIGLAAALDVLDRHRPRRGAAGTTRAGRPRSRPVRACARPARARHAVDGRRRGCRSSRSR